MPPMEKARVLLADREARDRVTTGSEGNWLARGKRIRLTGSRLPKFSRRPSCSFEGAGQGLIR